MGRYVVRLEEINQGQVAEVGGKGAVLGELSRIQGVRVPPGFCVTTDAFELLFSAAQSIDEPLRRLSRVDADDRDTIGALSHVIRHALEFTAIPEDVAAAVTEAYARLGDEVTCAVRSSATAEDLPHASFAGQQDTYLNVAGPAAILEHVRRCWASLFTERAATYRLRSGFDHHRVRMAVVVQQLISPDAAGILFTADPVTGNRKVTCIEAVFGLGDTLVSGRVKGDIYQVSDSRIVSKTITAKRVAVVASPEGGTREHAVETPRQEQPALTDAQVVRLAQLGRRIEAHFGRPQDVEWCLMDDDFLVVQSRPITTLFPIPETTDGENHVYISVGHQQMMTDPIRPLGLSFWQMTTPRPMVEAGGRLFVDVTRALGSPASRADLLALVGRSDPLIGDALRTVLERGTFVPPIADQTPPWTRPGSGSSTIETNPAIVNRLIEDNEASVAALKREIQDKTGPALLDFIRTDIRELRRILTNPTSLQVIMAGVDAAWWLNDRLHEWLGETNVADTLTLSVPHNVTSEMGLALLDVADAIRPSPNVVAFLERVEDDGFLDQLPGLAGGREAREAIVNWLDRYGMRCVGEIDITRPRWSERPITLLPLILGNVRNFEPGASARRFQGGRDAAATKADEILRRLRELPEGEQKAGETKRMIERVRTFAGYREYPKYAWICRYLAYKQALMREATRMKGAGILSDTGDIFYLRFDELDDVVRTGQMDEPLVRARRDEFRSYQALTPPRVLTSDGEAITGVYRRGDAPAGALVGLAVSSGTVEGRARVVLDLADADLQAGDILVTTFTDPSWTPLFVGIKALVTEVGGLMTHGAVIAREYGLPAVVGVAHATRLIRDGQWIRVDGTRGYVEPLPAGASGDSLGALGYSNVEAFEGGLDDWKQAGHGVVGPGETR